MVAERTQTTIGKVCLLGDGAHAKVERTANGVPYLTSKNIGKGSLKLGDIDYISEDDYDRLFPADSKAVTRLKPGDILTGIIGTFGNIYQYKDNDHFGISSAVAILRPDQEQLWPKYLFYYLSSSFFRQVHEAYAAGSVQGYTNLPTIRQLPAIVPPLPEQKAIAHILGTLDDKIELNRKMNATLEEMAQALFKSWFVDFDPVIDNALAAGNPIPEALANRAEVRRQALAEGTANREAAKAFPDSFQATEELGWIPEGWDVSKLEILAKPKKGKNITKKTIIEGNVPVVAGGLKPAYFHNTPNVNGPVITVSASGANAGFVNLYHQDIWASDCSYISSNDTGFIYSTFMFLKSRQDRITHMQQGAAQPHVYPKDLLRLLLANPPTTIWQDMEKTIRPSFHRIFKNEKENQTLTKLRDTLLPKLISGELRVSEAEQLTEEALA